MIPDGIKYLTTKEAAKAFGYHYSYLSKLCKQGKIDATIIGGSWVIKRSSLEEFVAKQSSEKIRTYKELSNSRKNEYQEVVAGKAEESAGPLWSDNLQVVSKAPAPFLKKPFAHAAVALSLVVLVGFLSLNLLTSAHKNQALTGSVATANTNPLTSVGEDAALATYETINSFFTHGAAYLSSLFDFKKTYVFLTPTFEATSTSKYISNASTTALVISPALAAKNTNVTNYYFNGATPSYVDLRFNQLLAAYLDGQDGSSNSGGGGGGSGSVTSVDISGGSTGLSFSGGPITSTGTFSLSGTLGISNGGTGTSTAPSYGQLFVGDGAGGYALVSTSSLNIVERSPRLAAEAVGRLNVSTLPEPVMVKSVPVVEVANVTTPEEICCPVGPIAVMVPEPAPAVIQTPFTAKQPFVRFMPPALWNVDVPVVKFATP